MPETARTISDLHSILGSETRVVMIHALAGGPKTVGVLVEIAGLSFSGASQHLSKLRAAGIVDSDRAGQAVTYRLVEPQHPLVASTLALLPAPKAIPSEVRT